MKFKDVIVSNHIPSGLVDGKDIINLYGNSELGKLLSPYLYFKKPVMFIDIPVYNLNKFMIYLSRDGYSPENFTKPYGIKNGPKINSLPKITTKNYFGLIVTFLILRLRKDRNLYNLLKNIIFDYEAIDINDAIKKCCEKLEEDYTDSTYTKDVLDIYKHNQMQIIRFNGVLLPHAVNKNNVYKNGVSILKLKTPVTIEKTKDKIDTIVCFAIRDKNNIGNDISNIINKVLRPKFKKIIKDKDKIGIISYLIN